MDGYFVHDVLKAYVLDENGNFDYYGCLISSNLSQTTEQLDFRCGIGNVLKAVLDTQKDITFTIQSEPHNSSFIEHQSGNAFQTGQTANVWKTEAVEAVDNIGTIEATITGTPVGDEVFVTDANNKTYTATYSTGTVTITDGVAGVIYNISYQEAEAGANVLTLSADTFAKARAVQLVGLMYDADGNPAANFYWNFPKAKPDGNLDLGYALATKANPSITFRALADTAGNYGEYIVVEL